MQAWSIVLCVLFVAGIIVFLLLTLRNNSNNQQRQSANILIPFAGYLAPPSQYWNTTIPQTNVGTAPTPDGGLFLTGLVGGTSSAPNTPQIQCPKGSSINIVGAYIEVNDPYGECTINSPDPTFSLSCGDGSSISSAKVCSTVDDCPDGMDCTGNRCLPKTCALNSDCLSANSTSQVCPDGIGGSCTVPSRGGPGPTAGSIGNEERLVCVNGTWEFDPSYGQCMMCSSGKCSNVPLCSNTTQTTGVFQNTVCTSGNCKIRDASAYLANHCDGQSTCLADASDRWIPDVNGAFGPLPCNINTTDPEYSLLPIIPGWNAGGIPHGGGTPVLANFSQGYYVHGLYTCIADNELPKPPTTTS